MEVHYLVSGKYIWHMGKAKEGFDKDMGTGARVSKRITNKTLKETKAEGASSERYIFL